MDGLAPRRQRSEYHRGVSSPVAPLLALLLVASPAVAQGAPFESIRIEDDLAGWSVPDHRWTAADGVITGATTADAPLVDASYLVWSTPLPDDFELLAEVRLDGGNSGLQFRSRVDAAGGLHGYQADLDAEHAYTGAIYHNDRGLLALRGEDVRVGADGTGSVQGLGDAATLRAAFREDAWNELRITARGAHLEYAINGEITARLVDHFPGAERSGVLAVQLHQGPPMTVRLRDLRVRALPPPDEVVEVAPPPPATWWIWSDEPARDGEALVLHRTLELPAPAARAVWTGAGDNHLDMLLDGRVVASPPGWEHPEAVDVSEHLQRAGVHHLALRARNDSGPAAVVARLDVTTVDGEALSWSTDASWTWTRPGDGEAPWQPVATRAPLGVGTWARLTPEQFERAARRPGPRDPLPDDLRVLDGFRLERLLRLPREAGSFVALAVDDAGRLYASDQGDRGLVRITLGAGDADPAVEPVPVDVSGAQGLCWFDGALFAVAQHGGDGPPGLYRLDDRDGDDALDDATLLRELEGRGEHGWHGLVPTAEGDGFHVVAGNSTLAPELSASRVPPVWGEDRVLPRLNDPGGHQVGVLAPGGCVYRVSLDGARWTLVSSGYRNPYDLALHPNGELFTFDADMEWDLGAPWYRPTRVCHVTSGSEFGWRNGSGKWPAHTLDSLPAVLDVGLGSPVGIAFGHGSSLPAPWNEALFLGDWSYGRLHAALLTPDGASFTGELHTVVTGRPFPVTDLVVHPDGALYVLTGGRGVQSALYRLTAEARDDAPAAPAAPSADDLGARALRRRLEALHGTRTTSTNAALETLWPALGHADRHVRFAARVALEWQPVSAWDQRALAEGDPRRGLAALAALVRVTAVDPERGDHPPRRAPAEGPGSRRRADVLSRLAAYDDVLGHDDPLRLDLLRVLELALVRLPAPDGLERRWLLRRFSPRVETAPPAELVELAGVLARLDDPELPARAVARLPGLATQEQRLTVLRALCEVRSGWTADARAAVARAFDDADTFAGGASFAGYLGALETRWRARLPSRERAHWDTRRAAHAAATTRGTSTLLAGRTDWHDWSVSELDTRLGDARGDVTRGGEVFTAAGCYACHRLDGVGGLVGPDLTGAGTRFTRRDLLEALVEPSAVVSDLYATTRIETVDGDVIRGQIVNLFHGGLSISTDATRPGAVTSVAERDIASMGPSEVSPMPEGLLGLLTADEIADLLAFLRASPAERVAD